MTTMQKAVCFFPVISKSKLCSCGIRRLSVSYQVSTRATPLLRVSGGGEGPSSSSRKESDLSEEGHKNAKGPSFHDIVIAGGGLVGTILAVALSRCGRLADKNILLLEAAEKFWTKPPDPAVTDEEPNFSNRVVALSPGSVKFLSKLNIWENVWRTQPVSCLQVWDALSDAHISFNNPEYKDPVAHIVENAVLAHAVSSSLPKASNVTVRFGSSLQSCIIPPMEKPHQKVEVVLSDGTKVVTDLLVGADGFNSRVRAAMNSPYLGFNYDRTAVVATLKLHEATDNRAAWQRFLPTGGPIALLPLSPQYSSLVWSTTPELAKKLMSMSTEEFVDAVNSAFWNEYALSPLVERSMEVLRKLNIHGSQGRMYPPSVSEVLEKSRATFPLGFGHSAHYVNRRAVLIGDAAHRVHPLAGQGLNLGIGDAETLQRVLDTTVGIGGDIGCLDNLREYETERQRHNLTIQSGIDLLHRLYNIDFGPIVALRSIGLSFVNSSGMLKTAIMSQAAA